MTAQPTRLLMHAVLDGEASPAQAEELQRLLAADPAAQAEFQALQRLFGDLDHVAQHHPPEGLVAGVMSRIDVPVPRGRRSNQLFTWPRVFGPTRVTGRSGQPPAPPYFRSIEMSQSPRSLSSRKMWVGGALAAAGVLVVAQFGLQGPTSEKDVMGTIAPAERYRAPQPTAADIGVAAPRATTPATQSVAGRPANDPAVSDNARAVDKARAPDGARATDAARAPDGARVADNAAANSAATDQAAANQARANQAAANQGAANQSLANQAAANQAVANQAAANQAVANQAAANQAIANQAFVNQAAAANAARVNQSGAANNASASNK